MISLKTNIGMNFRTSDNTDRRVQEIGLANDTIESQADELRKLGESIHASNYQTRKLIYDALAGAARFRVANALRSDELRELYRNHGIRLPREKAAPHLQLLPTIKLMLGIRDDVRNATRTLAENRARRRLQKQASDYAMALAFVLSKEPDPSGIAAFLDQPTMGIVEAASLYRHPTPGHRAKRSGADPFTHLRSDPPIASLGLDTLPFAVNGPIALILERNDVAWLVRAAVKELPAIRRLISSVKQTAIPNIQNSR